MKYEYFIKFKFEKCSFSSEEESDIILNFYIAHLLTLR